MLILIRNDGNHIEPLPESSELLVKVLDRTGRHISVVAITEDSNTNEVMIAVEPPLADNAKVVLRDGEHVLELNPAEIVAMKADVAAAEGGPEESDVRR